jgi:hypothetical protein
MRAAATCLKLLLATATGLVFCGCASPRFTTLVVYETPHAFVRLETDPTVEKDSGHSHPAHIPPEIMAAALAGIVIEDPMTRLPLYDDLSQPRRRPALTDEEIGRLAPLLSLALEKATPEEVVTFYESVRREGGKREVTSGGLFVAGDELRVLLSNVRSDTRYTADIGVADTEDDRLTPMRSLAPQRGRLSFDPAAAARDTAPRGLRRIFHWDRRELAILYRKLEPRHLDAAAPSTPGASAPAAEPR